MSYSVAIRTLGTSGEKLVRELKSIKAQTLQPEKVMIYIAEGYDRPSFQIGREEYIWVKKGMVAQRALDYEEINSDCLLLLDDDVELAPDSVERMIEAMLHFHADCVGADTFMNQDMSVNEKIYAALSNWVFPHNDNRWAFMVHRHGSFSYLNHPNKSFYWSQSCAGPCSLWRKNVLLKVRLQDELWLDNLGFAFGDDAVEFNKLYKNGYKLGILYNSHVKNLDGKTISRSYHSNVLKYYTRSKGALLVWWRCCFSSDKSCISKGYSISIFFIKCVWLLLLHLIVMIKERDFRVPYYFLKGNIDAVIFIFSKDAQNIPPYIINSSIR